VDDADQAITHVIRGKDHLANAPLHAALARALGAEPPEYRHHGLLVGADGTKLSKRHGALSLAELRERGIPPEAVRRYLEELGLPRGDVHLDEGRIRRLAVEALAALPDEELAARAGVDPALAPALRGAHDLVEARELARLVTETPPPSDAAPETLARFRDLRAAVADLDEARARALVAAVREGRGDLKALRLALTGRERGPELWAVVLALPRDEALRRAGG
jgi:glutamyl-tRNA synthetase